MRKNLPSPLPDHVELEPEASEGPFTGVATFTFPNAENPAKPFVCRVNVSEGVMELVPERSANHRRIIASLA